MVVFAPWLWSTSYGLQVMKRNNTLDHQVEDRAGKIKAWRKWIAERRVAKQIQLAEMRKLINDLPDNK